MFDRIAGVYDLMNTAMTAGLHHGWRERAADRAELAARATARSTSAAAPATSRSSCASGSARAGASSGADFSERMLELANEKALERGVPDVTFEWADALALPYSDASFDAVTVGFGVRNLADLDGGHRGDGARPAARRVGS